MHLISRLACTVFAFLAGCIIGPFVVALFVWEEEVTLNEISRAMRSGRGKRRR